MQKVKQSKARKLLLKSRLALLAVGMTLYKQMARLASSALTLEVENLLMLKVMLGQLSTQTDGVLQPSIMEASGREKTQAKILKNAKYFLSLK